MGRFLQAVQGADSDKRYFSGRDRSRRLQHPGRRLLPVDEEGKPLRKAILYGIDARCTEEMEEMTSYYGEERVQELFGRPICSGDVAARFSG